MIWRTMALLTGLVILLAALSPAQAQGGLSPTLTPEEVAWLDAHGPIRYVFNEGFAPFTLVDKDGAVRGINRDLLRLMSVNLGIEFVTVQTANFSGVLKALTDGTADVAGNLGVTPERDEVMDFTEPYAYVGVGLWIKEGTVLPDDMTGVKIAVVRATGSVSLAPRTWPQAEIVVVNDIGPGIEGLERGDFQAFLAGEAPTAYTIQQGRHYDIVLRGPPLETRAFSFAVPQGEAILLSILNKGLEGITREERTSIFTKWTGRDLNAPLPPQPAVSTRVAAILVAGTLGVAASILVPVWIVVLNRRVAARTREVVAANAALERRVEERTRELSETVKEMEGFSYSVSHDLRAPLRAIDGFLAAVVAGRGTRAVQEEDEDLARVREAAKRMDRLIQEMLQLSRLSRAEMRPVEIDITATADQVIRSLRETAPARDVTCHVEEGLRARGDPTLVSTLFANLIENAWKFTGRQAHATIAVGRARTPRGEAFFVRDDGAGFAPEFAHKLFVPFQRLHSEREFPGTGIGLATVKRIVTRHGGEIWAEGRPGQGATFFFTLPGASRVEGATA